MCEKRETRETTERENLSLLSLSRASFSQTKSRLIAPNNVKSEGATIVRKVQFKLTLVPAGQCRVLQVKHLGVYCRLAANSIQNT